MIIVMKILKQILFTLLIVGTFSLGALAQKTDDKKNPPPKDPPPKVVPRPKNDEKPKNPPPDKDKPRKPSERK